MPGLLEWALGNRPPAARRTERLRILRDLLSRNQDRSFTLEAMREYGDITAAIRDNEIGRRASVETPFGRRLISYADMTASGRYLHFLEAWMRRVRPFYANSHTAVSSTGRLVTELREEARRVVARAVNAGPADAVIFVGSGATAAINKLVGMLGIRIPEPLERRYSLSSQIPKGERPVVFIGPYEHHSNQLPWLESIADVVEIDLTEEGLVDVAHLETELARTEGRPLRIGSFSAASNVTGVLTRVDEVARILHRHGAYACFDYAAAAPYAPIDMHPPDPEARIDALFISSHKFVGGPGASGILVANEQLFQSGTPERPGGGTVDYVGAVEANMVDYVRRRDEREEGGTPAILGDLRAGAVFLIKDMVGTTRILEHELDYARRAVDRLSRHPHIEVLGPSSAVPRLAIISFTIEGLHHDFVSALLDHLFGIQNRSGCSCAGPYGHRLLGVDRATSDKYRQLTRRGISGIKPGWVRVTIPYYASKEDLDFLLEGIEFVADHGRSFVPLYRLDWHTGVWRHIERPSPDVPPLELTVDALEEASQSFSAGDYETPVSERQIQAERASYFSEARTRARDLATLFEAEPPEWNPPTGDPDVDALVWFQYVYAGALP